MGALDRIIEQTVSASNAAVSQAGFGVPMLLGYHDVFSELVREYDVSTAAASMVTDGFDSYDPLVRMATVVAGQNPRPTKLKIGKITAVSQAINVTPYVTGMVAGETFTLRIRYHDNTYEDITPIVYNGSDAVADICDDLVTALAALTGAANIDVTDNTTHVTIEPDSGLPAGSIIGVEETGYSKSTVRLLVEETTDAPSIATDLANIIAEDDDWYCVLCVHNAHAVIDRLASATEALRKIYLASSFDSVTYDSTSTTDVAYGLHASAYERTAIWYHQTPNEFYAAGMAGGRLAVDPGTEIFAFKTVKGPAVSVLSEARKSALEAKGCNYCSTIGGRNISLQGYAAAGSPSAGYFIDATRDSDWLYARMQEAVFSLFVSTGKVERTQKGIEYVLNAMRGVLAYGVEKKVLSPGTPDSDTDPIPIAWGPSIDQISATDLANRRLPDLHYLCRLSGGFQKVIIAGVVVL